jgi:hypothetical protein
MGRVATNAALWSTGDPVSWGVKTPTNAQLPEAGRAGYSKEAKNVPLDGQASCLSSGDACCLRDGAYASRLATLVRDGLSSAVHHYGDFGVGLRHAEVSEEKQCVEVHCLGTNPAGATPPEGEPLKLLSLAAEKYLPCTEDQAKYHQRDFRDHVQSDRRGDSLFPSVHSNLVPR